MPDPVLHVSVLGRVDARVDDHPIRPGRHKAIELIALLAFHPDGVDAEQLWEALWPERPLSRALLHTTVSATRRALVDASGGAISIADARRHGLYQVGGEVRLDWDRFRARDERGRLASALDLVRGAPFAAIEPGAYDWALGLRVEMETAIGAAASDLAARCLAQDDFAGARAAARAGLRALPYDTRLYRVLLRAAGASGDAGAAAAVRREMRVVLGAAPGDGQPA